MFINIKKKSDWRYIWDLYDRGVLIWKEIFCKYTLKHKIRLFLWVTGSISEDYYFYWISCNDKEFHLNKDKYFFKKIHNSILKKFTPQINFILNKVF